MEKTNVVIIGVGNCASLLVQGFTTTTDGVAKKPKKLEVAK